MKTILLFDPRFPDRRPTRLRLADELASAAVRSGIAAAANPNEAGALSAGGSLDPASLTPVVVQHGANGDQLARVMLPLSVVMVGAGLGLMASIGTPIAGVPTPTPIPALSALTLGASFLQENSAAGTVVGGIIGRTDGRLDAVAGQHLR